MDHVIFAFLIAAPVATGDAVSRASDRDPFVVGGRR